MTQINRGLAVRAYLVAAVLCGLAIGWVIGNRIGRRYFPTTSEQVADMLAKPHRLPGVERDAWAQLEIGMTKQEVASLIGEAQSVSRASNSEGAESETWQYEWSDGMITELVTGPSRRAHLVMFGSDGKVVKLRVPDGNDATSR